MNVDLSQLAIERDESAAPQVRARRNVLTRYVLPGVLVLGFVALIVSASRNLIFPAKPVKVVPVHVSHSEVQRGGTPLFKAAGWVQPRPTAVRVAALAPGVIEQLLVVEDQAVKQGEPIATLVKDDARLGLEQAVADRKLREAELAVATATQAAAQTRFDQPVHLEATLAEANATLAKIETALVNLPFEIRRAEARQRFTKADLESKQQAGVALSGIQVDLARSELDSATALVEELRRRGAALEKERDALTARRDALRTQLHLKADELRAKDEAAANVGAAEARLEQARVAEAEAQLRLDRMVVPAPIDGRVLNLVAQPGTRMMADKGSGALYDASTVVTMYRPDHLQVRVDVRFENLPSVQLGQPVLIESPAVAGPLDGEVLFISSLADIQKNTLEVKVAITNPPPVFKPEMLVDVTFLAPDQPNNAEVSQQQLRLYAPNNLVQRGEGGATIWVADQDAGLARRVAVETGPVTANGLVEIKQGLTAASRLITTGREDLDDGDRIKVTGEDEEP